MKSTGRSLLISQAEIPDSDGLQKSAALMPHISGLNNRNPV